MKEKLLHNNVKSPHGATIPYKPAKSLMSDAKSAAGKAVSN